MQKHFGILAIALAGLGVTATVAAADKADRAAKFAQLDADGSGALSMDELTALADMRFAKVDTDGDGALTVEELTVARAKNNAERSAKMVKRFDKDSDGKLTLAEMRGNRDPAHMFARIDKDGDGAISAEEFTQKRGRGRRKN